MEHSPLLADLTSILVLGRSATVEQRWAAEGPQSDRIC